MEGSDVVVVAAGKPRRAGMTREDLLKENAHVVESVSAAIREYAPKSIVIVITNPVDASGER